MLPTTIIVAAGVAFVGEPPNPENAPMLEPVPFTAVHIDDAFWRPRLDTNRNVTIPACLDKCEETGRIDNFAKAAGLRDGPHMGHRYDDSDVFKVMEGAAYALGTRRDPELERRLEAIIELVAAAQERDGYLYTTRTIDPEHPANAAGAERWSYLAHSHELYNVGHLYEAAVAHFMVTGRRDLLDVALRSADLVDREFGPGQRTDPPGHEEIEIGLVKLYAVTGERRYLDLARFLIDQRGRANGRELYGAYSQDHVPVTEQSEPIGHAVRAMYLYCAMADVAALTGDAGYRAALDRIWDNLVRTKLYLTGGVGARQAGEAFGDDFELPNASAYNETCAAIGNALWNHRMGLLHRDARYADVLERVLYNGFLSGVSLAGDRFFYPNPLASNGSYHRSPWFSCSCCPVNIARFVPSIAGLIYAHDGEAIFVNLFVQGDAQIALAGGPVELEQRTAYPWEGRIRLTVRPSRPMRFALHVRVPGWARGQPVPSDLYTYGGAGADVDFTVALNGQRLEEIELERGYLRLDRIWEAGDRLTLELAMPPRRVRCDERVESNRDRLAIERGPIVYCLEGTDHGGVVRNIWLPAEAPLSVEPRPDLLGGVRVIRTRGFAMRRTEDGDLVDDPIEITAVPYYAWDHREPGEMAVWIAGEPGAAEVLPPAAAFRVSASHCWRDDSAEAVHDGREPSSSADHEIPRFTWWDHVGTAEWIQYDFDESRWISAVEVYWFDDTGIGRCRVPARWRLVFKEGEVWKPVPAASGYGVEPDTFNRVDFDPVETTALRVEVELREGCSAGILEWRVE